MSSSPNLYVDRGLYRALGETLVSAASASAVRRVTREGCLPAWPNDPVVRGNSRALRAALTCVTALALWLIQMSGANAGTATLSKCQFHEFGGSFQGSCGKFFDETRTLKLTRVAAITTGVWSKTQRPESVWSGTMTEEGRPDQAIELEIYSGGWGVLRTGDAWVPVAGFTLSPEMSFSADATHEVAPNTLDRAIVRRAAAILSTVAVWNRADDRKCPNAATTWSIYCAMEKATIGVTGGFAHRRPALEVVRTVVDERTAHRNYDHRLMDYNNDPRTQLNDVKSLFAEALTRMNDPQWLGANGFVRIGP
jgi:hypothetical protein